MKQLKLYTLFFAAIISNLLTATYQYIDRSFGPDNNGLVSRNDTYQTQYVDMVISQDNSIYATGTRSINGTEQCILSKYSPNGQIDSSFAVNGTASLSHDGGCYSKAISLDSNGKIIVCGAALSQGSTGLIARYLASGALDNGFGTNGIVELLIGDGCAFNDCSIDSTTQKIIVAGSANIQGVPHCIIAAYLPDGTLDTSFGTDGVLLIDYGERTVGNALVINAEGIYVAGFTSINSIERLMVIKATRSGELDSSFGTQGIVTLLVNNSVKTLGTAIGTDTHGNIVVSGSTFLANKTIIGSTARFNSSGVLDSSFGTSGIVTSVHGSMTMINSLVIDSNNSIVIAGSTDDTLFIERLIFNGSSDTTFGTNGFLSTEWGSSASINSVDLCSSGEIIAAGTTDSQAGLVKYRANNSEAIRILSPSEGASLATTPVTITGQSTQSSMNIAVSIDGILVGSTTSDQYGNWHTSYPMISQGEHTIHVDLINSSSTVLASSEHTVTLSITDGIQITSPTANEIISLLPSYTAKGVSSLSSSAVDWYIDGAYQGTVTTNLFGSWTITLPPLTNGTHTLEVNLKSGSPASTIATGSVNVYALTPVLFPTGISQIKLVQGDIPTSGSGTGDGFSYSVSGSTITLTFQPAFPSTPFVIATGQRTSGSSTVTLSSVSTTAANLLFSTGTQRVHFTATLLI